MASFKAAFRYPFRSGNRASCLVGVGLCKVFLAMSYYFFSGPLQVGSQVIAGVFLAGFSWHLVALLRRDGPEAPAPRWRAHIKAFAFTGLKLAMFYALLAVISSMLATWLLGSGFALIVHFAITPFIDAAVYQSSGSKRLTDLVDIPKAIQLGKAAYWHVLGVSLLISLGFMAASFLLPALLATVGMIRYLIPLPGILDFPFAPLIACLVYAPLWVAMIHVLVQVFKKHESHPPEQNDIIDPQSDSEVSE